LRPLIGIPSSTFANDMGDPYNRVYAMPALCIARSGGLPVYIPTRLDNDTLRGIYERLDAVLLPGGPDIHPDYYGAERHPMTKVIDAERDKLEVAVTRWALDDDLPVFGICRGHQVFNVAAGGTLVQDIPAQLPESLDHYSSDDLPRSTLMHDVVIDPNSRLASILGTTKVMVNSMHHQSVEQPAPHTVVTAFSSDEVVEALEMPDKFFVLTVQWHPEDMYETSEEMRRLFDAFVQAARERARR
jgi:putative glutamine amidotransferase